MKISYEPTPMAWEPITPAGVASFALAGRGRLWLVQSVVALFVALVAVWFLHSRWYPTVQAAVQRLPPSGEIRNGELNWRGAARAELARGGYLAIDVNLADGGRLDRMADVAWVFGRSEVKVFSLLGYWEAPYPEGWVIAFNRRELEPWLGAWEPVIMAGVLAGVWVGLMLTWQVLALVYALPVRLVGLYSNRRLNGRGSWRLAGAALMPAALFQTGAIVAYGFEVVDLLRLLVAGVLHFVVGWVYLVVSPLFLPRADGAGGRENPFAGEKPGEGKQRAKSVSPFAVEPPISAEDRERQSETNPNSEHREQ